MWSSFDSSVVTESHSDLYHPQLYRDTFYVSEMDTQNASNQNPLNPCALAVVGETDKLCEAFLANSLVDDIEQTNTPTTLCYSPDDNIIGIHNMPNLSASPLLSELTLLGQRASGQHSSAVGICLFAQVLNFPTSSSTPLPNSIDPITDSSQCTVSNPTSTPTGSGVSAAPTSSPVAGTTPNPTVSPTTSPPVSAAFNRRSIVGTIFMAIVLSGISTMIVIVV